VREDGYRSYVEMKMGTDGFNAMVASADIAEI
jgi:hypothetical protein